MEEIVLDNTDQKIQTHP